MAKQPEQTKWWSAGPDGTLETIDDAELREKLSNGALPGRLLVWRVGWVEWLHASQVAELASSVPKGERRFVTRPKLSQRVIEPPAPPLEKYKRYDAGQPKRAVLSAQSPKKSAAPPRPPRPRTLLSSGPKPAAHTPHAEAAPVPAPAHAGSAPPPPPTRAKAAPLPAAPPAPARSRSAPPPAPVRSKPPLPPAPPSQAAESAQLIDLDGDAEIDPSDLVVAAPPAPRPLPPPSAPPLAPNPAAGLPSFSNPAPLDIAQGPSAEGELPRFDLPSDLDNEPVPVMPPPPPAAMPGAAFNPGLVPEARDTPLPDFRRGLPLQNALGKISALASAPVFRSTAKKIAAFFSAPVFRSTAKKIAALLRSAAKQIAAFFSKPVFRAAAKQIAAFFSKPIFRSAAKKIAAPFGTPVLRSAAKKISAPFSAAFAVKNPDTPEQAAFMRSAVNRQRLVIGIVGGAGALLLIALLVHVASGPSHAKSAASPHASAAPGSSAAAKNQLPAAAPTKKPALTSACTAAGGARRLAPAIRPGVPLYAADAPGSQSVAIGYASSATGAVGGTLDLTSLKWSTEHKRDGPRKVLGVVPLTASGTLHFAVDRTGSPLDFAHTVDANPPFIIGAYHGGIARVLGYGDPESLWPNASAHAITEPSVAEARTGFAVAFRRKHDVAVGWLTPEGRRKTDLGALTQAGASVGTPHVAVGGHSVLVTFAMKTSGDAHFGVALAKAELGEVPSSIQSFDVPPGGPGGDAMSPTAAALGGGRWLLQWTEGSPGAHVVRVQTLNADLAPIGAPITVSSATADSGQGAIVARQGHAAALFLVHQGKGYELWATSLACP